ncbi:MAG: CPBP family intramembrane metalloprotease, partial [Chitinophagaceae bacterium]
PLLETLIFQYAIIETCRKKYHPMVCCLISATAFSVFHFYNPIYVIYAFFAGMMFGYFYFIRTTVWRGVLLVFFAHFFYNSLVFLVTLP